MITNYTLHQTPGDTTTYSEHLEEHKRLYGDYPKQGIFDAGYGSEENYQFAEDNGITSYVKYNYFHKEWRATRKDNPFLPDNLHYDLDSDCFCCPMCRPMKRVTVRRQATSTGFIWAITLYRAVRCADCPLRGACHKAAGERVIEVNHNLRRHRELVEALLTSPGGMHHRSLRPVEVGQTSANLKADKGFRRFLCRGLEKVSTEFGLLAIAHNISKMALTSG